MHQKWCSHSAFDVIANLVAFINLHLQSFSNVVPRVFSCLIVQLITNKIRGPFSSAFVYPTLSRFLYQRFAPTVLPYYSTFLKALRTPYRLELLS